MRMSTKLNGGKLAPRLLGDILEYDPVALTGSGYHPLTDVPQYDEERTTPSQRGSHSCIHDWKLDHDRTSIPTPASKTEGYLVAHCHNCRAHLTVMLSFDHASKQQPFQPCPQEDIPMHHFVHLPNSSLSLPLRGNAEEPARDMDLQLFECSSETCGAKLYVSYRPARLLQQWIDQLTDENTIARRHERVSRNDPIRFEGIGIPTVTDVLSYLREYVTNALASDQQRNIQPANKKFMLSFGETPKELFEYLDFEYTGEVWRPPCPGPPPDHPLRDSTYNHLSCVANELLILIMGRPVSEKVGAKIPSYFTDIRDYLAKLLGTKDYSEGGIPGNPTHPWYAGLGAVRPLIDEYINFAYECQIRVDPANTAYYLECLQGIANGRKSDELATKAAIEASKGTISTSDVRNAYRYLNIEDTNLDDDTIVGIFRSRLADAPPYQEEELREALRTIGSYRSSKVIEEASSKEVETYSQALGYLGATSELPDEAMISLFTIKRDECPADENTAYRAVKIIAEHRDSGMLRAWCNGNDVMDVGEAYTIFGMSDRTIDDEIILAVFDSYVSERPSQVDDYKRALLSIAKDKDSALLLNFLEAKQMTEQHKLAEWPSYFTIKPLRQLVIQFENYRMPINAQTLSVKQVGSRRVSKKEVERAQRFMVALRTLFESMIHSPKAEVTPEQELARLTLLSSTNEEKIRRRSTTGGQRPSLGEINGQPILGPMLPLQPQRQTNEADTEMTDSPNIDPRLLGNHNGDTVADDSSEGTLVDTSVPPLEDQESVMSGLEEQVVRQPKTLLAEKENISPRKADSAYASGSEDSLEPLALTSPSRTNKQHRQLSPVTENDSDPGANDQYADVPPPNRPPPVPPRARPVVEAKESVQEQLEIGAQQDVNEVIGNVLFQMQCAIKADRIDETGEQLDVVKRLFYGKQKSNTIDRLNSTRTKEAFFSDLKVNLFSQPYDICAALDDAFDIQNVEVKGVMERQYTTISQLPPVLQILIVRADYDKVEQTIIKSDHHVELRETIFMDRYMDSPDPDINKRREECWRWKEELTELKAQKEKCGAGVSESLTVLGDVLLGLNEDDDPDRLPIPSDLPHDLKQGAVEVKEKLSNIESSIKDLQTNLESQFADCRELPYHLHSVYMHRGGGHSGHYWVYIYDFADKLWRKYNDGHVTKVDNADEIYKKDPQETRPATPYFLVYIREGYEESLTDAVCREPIDLTPGAEDLMLLDPNSDLEVEHKEYAVNLDASHTGRLANWLQTL